MGRKPINAVLGGALERKLRVPLEPSDEHRKVCVCGGGSWKVGIGWLFRQRENVQPREAWPFGEL